MDIDTVDEEWRPIDGDPFYEVSSHGRVRSLPRRIRAGHGWRMTKFLVLKPNPCGNNAYLCVRLTGKRVATIHTLVCAAFHGPRPSARHDAAHKDGNPINNREHNLRWATRKENMADAIEHGRTNRGIRSPMAKLTEADVIEIRRFLVGGSRQQDIAEKFGISQPMISRIKSGLSWAHL